MEKVLIAGGSGFIGRRLTALLQQSGYAVGWMS
ncbi:MAG TPA: TIGR01777 family protein, partial [Bacteroidetes bacterium]|nr:TIGR01777 family protein [Bacteroidota bacterium]